METYHVIIPAAGKGTRMGRDYNKLRITLNHQTLLEHTLDVFEADEACEGIYLAIHPRDRKNFEDMLKPYQKVKAMVDGGAERQESIHRVLRAVSLNDEDTVIVHDGARPFISQATIHRLLDAIKDVGAAVIGVKAKDTIKVVTDQYVTQTLNRDHLWQVQTPQGATFKNLKTAYDQAAEEGFVGTDDASLLENAGHAIYMVEGEYDNIKVTTEEDLTYAEAILKKRGEA